MAHPDIEPIEAVVAYTFEALPTVDGKHIVWRINGKYGFVFPVADMPQILSGILEVTMKQHEESEIVENIMNEAKEGE